MPRIEEMYAFIVEDSGPDDEGVIGIQTEPGTDGKRLWLPLVASFGINYGLEIACCFPKALPRNTT
ncbi:unnamed protein product [marine sediment metagenome]|uniref:Uncharacterized protein n=1 Tax=marine sediment metagenome TaxID=412755 RepID=X1SY33_9ZZZZ